MTPCVHRWLVQPPTYREGETELAARCRRCRQRRTFPAWPERDHTLDMRGVEKQVIGLVQKRRHGDAPVKELS